MKFVWSDSPGVAREIASAGTLAKRHLQMFLPGLLLDLPILLIALAGLVFSMFSLRVAIWICLPPLLGWNAWMIWRARSPGFSWVIKAGAGRVYIRLYVGFGKVWRRTDAPDVAMLEASEVDSMSIRAIEVFVYGPKPKLVEWLTIRPSQAVESASDQIPSFLQDTTRPDWSAPYLDERVYWANDEQRLVVGWKLCQPALSTFLQQIARECPSIIIGPEERSELDLNGIWHGYRRGPDAQQRRMLAQAKSLGFGPECVKCLNIYRGIPFRECAPYLAEIEQEEAEAERSDAHTT
jgi:hypothetical protein